MIGIGVIGYGYWGPNWVRNFSELDNARVVAVSDLSPARLAQAARRTPGIRTCTDHRELLAAKDVDAVVIVTPVSTHFELGMQAIVAGKHVLMEKPFTATSVEGARLVENAARARRVLMVDHTFIYTPAVRKIQELVASGALGTLNYYDSVRISLGIVQTDVNVLWDLAVHDLAIMDHIIAERPRAVSAVGTAHVNGMQDVAYLTCHYDNNLIAHLHVNWLSPVKVRRTMIGGSSKMVIFDDVEPSEKVKVYDSGVTTSEISEYQKRVSYRTGDMWAPRLESTEALRTEASHFVDCVMNGGTPLTDGHSGLRMVRLLEQAGASMRLRGQPMELTWN